MIPLPLALLDWAALPCNSSWSTSLNLRHRFRQLPGDRLIEIDHSRLPSGMIVRRFQPTMEPLPWEIQVATTADGLEQFAVTVHEALCGDVWVSVHPSLERPIHLQRAYYDAKGRNLGIDGCMANRYRYSHPDEGVVDWFIINVTAYGLRERPWLFEHPSLYSEVRRERLALPRPTASDPSSHEGLSLVPLNAKVDLANARVEGVAEELVQLRADLPDLVAALRRYEDSSAGIEERLDQILKGVAATKRMKEKIDALEELDAVQREQLHLSVDCAFDKAIERFKRSIDIELE